MKYYCKQNVCAMVAGRQGINYIYSITVCSRGQDAASKATTAQTQALVAIIPTRMNMNQIVDLIKQKHQDYGIDVQPPATLSEIAEFEKQIGFSLPTDFREFYSTCNGFGCNEDIFNMVPLQGIRLSQQDYGDNWFYFSEYMIYSDMWGLRRTTTGQFEIFNGSYPDKTMTFSLTEFLQRFLIGNVFETGGLYDWHDELGIK